MQVGLEKKNAKLAKQKKSQSSRRGTKRSMSAVNDGSSDEDLPSTIKRKKFKGCPKSKKTVKKRNVTKAKKKKKPSSNDSSSEDDSVIPCYDDSDSASETGIPKPEDRCLICDQKNMDDLSTKLGFHVYYVIFGPMKFVV